MHLYCFKSFSLTHTGGYALRMAYLVDTTAQETGLKSPLLLLAYGEDSIGWYACDYMGHRLQHAQSAAVLAYLHSLPWHACDAARVPSFIRESEGARIVSVLDELNWSKCQVDVSVWNEISIRSRPQYRSSQVAGPWQKGVRYFKALVQQAFK